MSLEGKLMDERVEKIRNVVDDWARTYVSQLNNKLGFDTQLWNSPLSLYLSIDNDVRLGRNLLKNVSQESLAKLVCKLPRLTKQVERIIRRQGKEARKQAEELELALKIAEKYSTVTTGSFLINARQSERPAFGAISSWIMASTIVLGAFVLVAYVVFRLWGWWWNCWNW